MITSRMRLVPVLAILALSVLFGSILAADGTTCEMSFKLERWSTNYKMTHGSGSIACSNGEAAQIRVRLATDESPFGEVRKGVDLRASFSGMTRLDELFGAYIPTGSSGVLSDMIKDGIALSVTPQGSTGPADAIPAGTLTISLLRGRPES